MPGLIRGVARTAVVAGTATAVSNRVSRRQAGRWSDQEQQAYEQQQAYPSRHRHRQPPTRRSTSSRPTRNQRPHPRLPPPVQAPPADVDMDSKLLQLRQLGELKTQGILSDAEFEAQKAKILGT